MWDTIGAGEPGNPGTWLYLYKFVSHLLPSATGFLRLYPFSDDRMWVRGAAFDKPLAYVADLLDRTLLPAAIAYEDELNTFTLLQRFEGRLELKDLDGTPVADRRLSVVDGLFRALTTANAEGRFFSRLSLEQLTDAEIAVGANIDAAKIGTGIVSNAEFNFLDGVTSAIQTQLDNRLKRDGTNSPSADINWGGFKITNAANPAAAQDYATKSYVDALVNGLDVKASVRLATAAALSANTYDGGTKRLTASANGALSVDSVAVAVDDRILVKNEATGSNNGLYKVIQTGSVGTPYILERTSDADVSAEVTSGMFTFVSEGTVHQKQGWSLTTADPITLDTTALVFTQFSEAGAIVDGAGLQFTGNVLDINAGDGLEIVADFLRVKLDGSTIARAAAGIKVATGGITNNEINAAAAIAYSKLNLASSIVLADLALLTAKGDLLTHDGTDHVALAAGVDRAVPIYKAAATEGIEVRKLQQADMSYIGSRGHSFVDHWIAGSFAGETNWASDNSGAGAVVTANSLALVDGNHPGIAEFDTGTATTGQASIHKGTRTIRLGGGKKVIEMLVRLEDLSSGASEYDVYLGLSNRKDTSNNFVGFVYDRNTSVNWLFRTVDNGTPTTTDTGIAVTADAWIKLRIEINADATSIDYFVDGASGGAAHTTNIPTAAGREVGPRMTIIKSASTNNRFLYVDYYGYEEEFTTDS